MTDIEIVLQAITGDNFSEEKRNCWQNQKLENKVQRSDLESGGQKRRKKRSTSYSFSQQYFLSTEHPVSHQAGCCLNKWEWEENWG